MSHDDSLHFNETRLVNQLGNFLPQIHLTLVSVLQGIALVYLMTAFHSPVSFEAQSIWNAMLAYHFYIPYIVSFLLIIIIWNQFASATFFLHWPLTSTSTIFQFILTIFEVAAFTHIDFMGLWICWIGASGVTGALIHTRNLRIVSNSLYIDGKFMIGRGTSNRFYWMLAILIPIGLLREMAINNFHWQRIVGTTPFMIFDIAFPALLLISCIYFLYDDDRGYVNRCNAVFTQTHSRYRLAPNGKIIDVQSPDSNQTN